ncbi:MAG TPA: Asp23/Gls24 family envelope stress response protein [Candidatus Limnocylindrales bacterium]
MSAPMSGRSLVTRRAIRDLVRTATLSTYGVTGFSGGGPLGGLLGRLGIAHPGLRLDVGESLTVDLDLTVAYGLPVAEVARQVDASVRYALADALGREPDRISIRIGHLVHEPGHAPGMATDAHGHEPRPADLAGSGTDVA